MHRLLSLILTAFLLAFPVAVKAEIIVDGSQDGTPITTKSGGMIELHEVPSPFVVSSAYQSDARALGFKTIRMGSFPSPVNADETLADFDAKVATILAVGAQPLFYAPITPGVAGYIGGTPTSNIVALVKHYQQAPFNLMRQTWEVGNEPDAFVDYKVPNSQAYITQFTDVHNALVAAGLRNYVTLMGPVTAGAYTTGKGFRETIMNDFLAACHDIVDVVSWHTYGNLSARNNMTVDQFLQNPYQVERLFDFNASDPYSILDPNVGPIALIKKMRSFTYARGASLAITEHNGFPAHTLHAGLLNLAVTGYAIKNRTEFPVAYENTFIFDQNGDRYLNLGEYNSDGTRDYTWWSNWIVQNRRGNFVLKPVLTNQQLSQYGNGKLLVTVTKTSSEIWVEVINRSPETVSETVTLTGITSTGLGRFELSATKTPDATLALGPLSSLKVDFPGTSATILRFGYRKSI